MKMKTQKKKIWERQVFWTKTKISNDNRNGDDSATGENHCHNGLIFP